MLFVAEATARAGSAADRAAASELATEALDALHAAEDSDDEAFKEATYHRGQAIAQHAVDLDPDNADAQYVLFAHTGRLMGMAGTIPNPFNIVTLRRSLNRALEINPNHAEALVARGTMKRRLPRLLGGDLDESVADLQRAMELDPTLLVARIELARTYLALDRIAAARSLLEETRKLAIENKRPSRQAEAERILSELPREPVVREP